MAKAGLTIRGPLEADIQDRLKDFLRAREWLVEQTHGNEFQNGFPDLYCFHRKWEYRWIDCKRPGKYSFTKAQRIKWPLWDKFGVGIWILTDATQNEYDKLFHPPNWRDYWKPSWGAPDIESLLKQLDAEAESPKTSIKTNNKRKR